MTPIAPYLTNLQDSSNDASYDTPAASQEQKPLRTSVRIEYDTGDFQYAKALAASREEFHRSLDKCKSQQKKDRQANMILSLSNEFAPLSTPGADTLIYIGPPPRARGQSSADYHYIEARFSHLHRMNSQTLKDLGSSAFEKLLGPKSERTRRRFGRDGLLTGIKTEGIKYYIDLRPAEEGDEAVELVTDLTCTRGILNWYKAEKKYSIAPTMICGRDDFVSPLDQFREAEAKEGKKLEDGSNETEPLLPPEAEYSALRHRSAIERVLQAIGHNDPKIDSAPKMWTFFQVAKHLDVAKHERLSGWITKWLYSHPNSNFIQNNPEAVYRIGLGTMSLNMICDGYSMLAGEKALLDTSDPSLRMHLKTSVHGRPLEILDDDERNRIDHAAASLHARIKLRFEHLIDDNMDWLKRSKEYNKLSLFKPRNDEEKELIASTDKMIKDYVRGRILWVLAGDYLSDHADFDQALGSCREFREGLPTYFNEVYKELSEEQRLLTRTLWIALQAEKLEEGTLNAWTSTKGTTGVLHVLPHNVSNSDHCPICSAMLAREVSQPGTGLKKVYLSELAAKIDDLNKVSARHFVEDKMVDHTLPEETPNIWNSSSSPGELYPKTKDLQIESSTAQGKHDLIDVDSEADAPLEMMDVAEARSGSEKRPRLSIDLTDFHNKEADFWNAKSLEIQSAPVSLSLRVAKPGLSNEEIAAHRAENVIPEVRSNEHITFWENGKRGNHGIPGKKAAWAKKEIPEWPENSVSLVPSSYQDEDAGQPLGWSGLSSNLTALAFDTHAKAVAEENAAASWRSFDGDEYVRLEPDNLVEQDAQNPDADQIWFAKPHPFKNSETTVSTGIGYWQVSSAQKYEHAETGKWFPGQLSGNDGWQGTQKKYWRATTCQLYCMLPDGSVNLVREHAVATPTLAEASARIFNNIELRNYTLAYDAYARHLAEILVFPYWTALNGDMYLRNPTEHMDPDANVWMLASFVFDSAIEQARWEGSTKVEYWRAPAGHLFRRRLGRIELYTEGKEEAAPPNSASILSAPLKISTKRGTEVMWPPARFLDRKVEEPTAHLPQESRLKSFKRSPVRTAYKPAPTTGYIYIPLQNMLCQFSDSLGLYCEDILYPPHIYHGADPIPRDLMDTLMCLDEDEWKYLPLWAGGCDDGTGGVFDEVDVPNLETGGFAGGKRGLGSDTVDGKGESEGWSEVGSSDVVSTLGRASKLATDGTATVKSFDSQSSASEFMRTDELWEQIRNMKGAEDWPVQAQAGEKDEDQVTVMGAASDIQGELFGDIDDDREVEGMDKDEEEDDDDFEIVDDSEDAFVPVAKDGAEHRFVLG